MYYVGMVNSTAYCVHQGENFFVGAASSKMVSVVAALRRVGARSVLISLPVPGSNAQLTWYPSLVVREGKCLIRFLSAYRSPLRRKVFGGIELAYYLFCSARRGETVVFYNHEIEYFAALIVLKLKGVRVIHDIEDVPSKSDRSVRGNLALLGYWALMSLSSRRKLVASEQIGRILKIQEFCAVQGITPDSMIVDADGDEKWKDLSEGGALRIHFGGTLSPDTGVDLFCGAVLWLIDNAKSLAARIEFHVTGIGNIERLEGVAKMLADHQMIGLDIYRSLDRKNYVSVIESCHVALSLKLPDGSFANTTFPSKVVEITSRGLALITTRVSDVPDLFGPGSVFFLEEVSPEGLGRLIAKLSSMPEIIHAHAVSGATIARNRFAPHIVGERLARFLDVGDERQ